LRRRVARLRLIKGQPSPLGRPSGGPQQIVVTAFETSLGLRDRERAPGPGLLDTHREWREQAAVGQRVSVGATTMRETGAARTSPAEREPDRSVGLPGDDDRVCLRRARSLADDVELELVARRDA